MSSWKYHRGDAPSSVDVHDTPYNLAYAYIQVIHEYRHLVRKALISGGAASCELHGGIVVEADTPEELERKLGE